YHRTKKESKAYIRKVEMAYHTNRLLNSHLLNFIYLPEETFITFTENERRAISNLIISYKDLLNHKEFKKQKKDESILKKKDKDINKFNKKQIKSHII